MKLRKCFIILQAWISFSITSKWFLGKYLVNWYFIYYFHWYLPFWPWPFWVWPYRAPSCTYQWWRDPFMCSTDHIRSYNVKCVGLIIHFIFLYQTWSWENVSSFHSRESSSPSQVNNELAGWRRQRWKDNNQKKGVPKELLFNCP